MVELVQDQGSEYDTHSLDAAAQHAIQLLAVALLQLHAKTSVGPHASSMRKHICHWNCFTKTFSGGHGPSLWRKCKSGVCKAAWLFSVKQKISVVKQRI